MCIRVCTYTHSFIPYQIFFSFCPFTVIYRVSFTCASFRRYSHYREAQSLSRDFNVHNQLCVARARLLLSRIMLNFFFSRVWGSVRINWGVSVRTVSGVICPVIATYEIEWFYRALTKSLFLRIDYFSFLHLSHKYITSSSFSSFSFSLFFFSASEEVSVYSGLQIAGSRVTESSAFGAESLKIYEPWATDNWGAPRCSGNR